MRKRIAREGGVGLLLLIGLGLFGVLILWLRGFGFGKRTYSTVVEFDNVSKMQLGAAVRYRGVEVGRITKIEPKVNSVDVTIELSPAAIVPRDVLIEANQAGIVGETSVDITPLKPLPPSAETFDPLDPNCDRNLIICDGARLQGETGVSYDQLLRSTLRISELFGNPEFYNNLNTTVEQIGNAADNVAILSDDLAQFTRSAEQQLTTLSDSVKSVSAAADQIRISVAQGSDRLTLTANQATEELSRTATQVNRLLANVDNLVTANRSTIVTTLNNLSQTSNDLRVTVGRLTPLVNRVEQSSLIADLEVLSANAVETSANLRDLSNEINSPTNLLMIQQTLDSARATFQNVQKITSDLDDLTGDPAFRNNLRNLVNGLSNLVSSTEQLQQQAEFAHSIDSTSAIVSDSFVGENWYLSNSSSFSEPIEIPNAPVAVEELGMDGENQTEAGSDLSVPSAFPSKKRQYLHKIPTKPGF